MKAIHYHIYAILALFCIAAQSKAQNNVGIGTPTPNPKALLELYSTNKGLLVPRLDRNAIATPTASDEGLLVYDINDHRFFYWTANVWEPIPDLDWIISGINQYSGVAGNVGIGTPTPQAKLHTVGTLRFENLLIGNDDDVLIINPQGNISRRTLPSSVWSDNDPNPANELNISFLYDPITHIISISDGGGTLSATLSNLGITNIISGNGLSGTNIGNVVTLDVEADNGLYVNSTFDKVRLGGSLVEQTLIDFKGYNLLLNEDGVGHFEVQNNGNPTLVVTNDSTIGINTATTAPNTIVEISSTKKGILVPKMTTIQRDAIPTPTLGLIIYNVTDSVAQHWNGECWLSMFRQSCDECDFTISLSDSLGEIDKIYADSATTTININQTFGNTTPISIFYLQNLPVGATASLSNYTITGNGSSILTVKANVFTAPGIYPIAIQAICGSTIKVKTFLVKIDSCLKVYVTNNISDYNLQLINSLPTNVPICVIATIDAVAKVTGVNSFAFNSGNLHPLSHVGIVNHGEVYGRGGDGAPLASFSSGNIGVAGSVGNHAINLTTRTSIINNGYIFGGGGGGGSVGLQTPPLPVIGSIALIGVGGGGGAPNGLGGNATFGMLFSAGANGTGGLNGAGGGGGTLNVPVPIPLGPVTLTVTPNAYGGDGGNYGFDGTSSALSASLSISVPIIGTINLGTYPNPPFSTLPAGGLAGYAIKRNNNILIGIQDANYQTFQIRGQVGQ